MAAFSGWRTGRLGTCGKDGPETKARKGRGGALRERSIGIDLEHQRRQLWRPSAAARAQLRHPHDFYQYSNDNQRRSAVSHQAGRKQLSEIDRCPPGRAAGNGCLLGLGRQGSESLAGARDEDNLGR
jgi:hypothetical protein